MSSSNNFFPFSLKLKEENSRLSLQAQIQLKVRSIKLFDSTLESRTRSNGDATEGEQNIDFYIEHSGKCEVVKTCS